MLRLKIKNPDVNRGFLFYTLSCFFERKIFDVKILRFLLCDKHFVDQFDWSRTEIRVAIFARSNQVIMSSDF